MSRTFAVFLRKKRMLIRVITHITLLDLRSLPLRRGRV